MKTYERDGNFLVVLDAIPQWFIVDHFGLEIAQDIEEGLSLEEVLAAHSLVDREEIIETYEELRPLFDQVVNNKHPFVSSTLTAKTTVAMISVTRFCNLMNICPHCYVNAGGSRDVELTVEEHAKIASGICNSLTPDSRKVYKINLTGGEPFFHSQIIEIIRIYRAVGLEVNMSTNAMLIKPEQILDLAEMGVVLSVSLDGSSPETHDAIRGHGAWLTVTNKVRALTSSGIKVGINCLMHSGNQHELESMIWQAHQLGCSGFNPINLVQLGRATHSKLKRVSETEAFRRTANLLANHPELNHLFSASSMFSALGAALTAGITCESCGVGNRPCVYIDETGNVYPCPNTQRPEFLLGNIRKTSLEECVRIDHPVLKLLRCLKIGSLNEKCAACDIRYFCGGDCRGETYNVTGDLREPYVACSDRHDSIIELMWIVAAHPEFFETRADEYITNLH